MKKTKRARQVERECDAIAKKHALEYHLAVIPQDDKMRVRIWSDEHGFIDGHTIQGETDTMPQLMSIPSFIEGLCETWYKTLPKA